MATVQFAYPLNVSVQPTDKLYATVPNAGQSGSNHPSPGGVNTKPFEVGIIDSINYATSELTYTSTGGMPVGNVYLFASKDNRINMSGILGYFAEVELVNHSTKAAEIFVVAADYVPSSK